MKEKISVLLLALVLLVMASCAPSGTAKGDAARQPEPLNALKTETSDPPVIQPDIAYMPNILLDIPIRLLGFPQAPDWPLSHPVEHALRRGSMLRITSREKVTL